MTSTEHHDDRDLGDQAEDTVKDAVTGGSTTCTVKSALFEYRDHETGARRIAVRGDVVELSAADVRRGERAGALLDDDEAPIDPQSGPVVAPRTPDHPEPAGVSRLEHPGGQVAPTDDRGTPTGDLGPVDPAAQPSGRHAGVERPRQVESKSKWVEYAVAQGAQRGEAEALSKDELIDRYGRD